MRTTPSAALIAICLPGIALAGRVPVAKVEASSFYTEQGSYLPEKTVDGKQATSWVEGENGSGLGEWIELQLEGETKLTGIKLWAGDWSSYEYWQRANRPKELELKFSDDSIETITLKDEKIAQVFPLDKTTTSVKIKIKSTYSGSTWLDTGIAEVQLMGEGAGVSVDPTGFASSSNAPEDGDGNYLPANASDGLADSMWCEGNADSDGTGEWIEFTFPQPTAMSKLSLINGMGSGLGLWMKANRATAATLSFDGGAAKEIELQNTIRDQTVEFAPVTATKVRLTFTGVIKGREYNDLCVSEARFSE